MTHRCPWTGAALPSAAVPAQQKKFASATARNQAHTAARMYTEQLIAEGFLSWEQVRRWYDGHKQAAATPCTAQQQEGAALAATSPAGEARDGP